MDAFTAVFEQDGDWWIGYIEELPGANTQGRTLDETRENLREALQLILECNRDNARKLVGNRKAIRETMSLADA